MPEINSPEDAMQYLGLDYIDGRVTENILMAIVRRLVSQDERIKELENESNN